MIWSIRKSWYALQKVSEKEVLLLCRVRGYGRSPWRRVTFWPGYGKQHTKSGYDYYISSAQTASDDEKIELYRSAIALNPTREDAYLDMLDTMLSDNDFPR